MLKFSPVIFFMFFLVSCSTVPGGEVYVAKQDRINGDKTPSIGLDEIEFVKITAKNTKDRQTKKRVPYRNLRLEQQIKAYAYKVASGDVLQVTVWEHPELINIGTSGLPAAGFEIDSLGSIFYPYVGRFKVAGKSVDVIRESLSEALSKYIENPQLDVRVTKFAAKKVYLTGEFKRILPISIGGQAVTLLDAINLAGGVTAKADVDDLVVLRNGKRRHIDLYALLHYGDMRQNILLVGGDQIHIASRKVQYAHIMGQVIRPRTIPMNPEGVNLADALSGAGGINEFTADAKAIYIIRNSVKAGKVAKIYMLDLSNMAAMVLATKFELKNSDIVYVAKSPIVKWNQLLAIVSPTMNAANALAATKIKVVEAIAN